MAAGETPVWRQAFNKAERAVGEPLERAVDTRQFADMMSLGAKARKALQRQIYGTVNRTLHSVGLSTRKDTREIARQLNRVQAQLREVSTQLEYLEEREQTREEAEPPSGSGPRSGGQSPPDSGPTPKAPRKASPIKRPAPVTDDAPAKKAASASKSRPARKTSSTKGE